MLESNMAAALESKMAAISGFIILASGAVRNLIVVFKHMFQGMRDAFLRLSRCLEYGIRWKLKWRPYWNPNWLPFQALVQHILAFWGG